MLKLDFRAHIPAMAVFIALGFPMDAARSNDLASVTSSVEFLDVPTNPTTASTLSGTTITSGQQTFVSAPSSSGALGFLPGASVSAVLQVGRQNEYAGVNLSRGAANLGIQLGGGNKASALLYESPGSAILQFQSSPSATPRGQGHVSNIGLIGARGSSVTHVQTGPVPTIGNFAIVTKPGVKVIIIGAGKKK